MKSPILLLVLTKGLLIASDRFFYKGNHFISGYNTFIFSLPGCILLVSFSYLCTLTSSASIAAEAILSYFRLYMEGTIKYVNRRFLFFELILERERERNTDLLFHLFMHSLVDSCMCPDQRQNPKPWCIGATL